MTIDDICHQMTQPNTFYNNLLVRYFSPSDVPLVISELALAYLKDRNKMNKIIEEGNINGYFARSIYFYATKDNLKMILSGETTISRYAQDIDGLELSESRSDVFDELYDTLLQCNVPFRDAQIFKLVYFDGKTYREINEEFGWSASTVCRSIQKSILLIKSKLVE